MASNTPDLSRIVNLILENPKLIEEVAALAKSDAMTGDSAEVTETAPSAEDKAQDNEIKASEGEESAEVLSPVLTQKTPPAHGKETRNRLIAALKPYLSENRKRAVDSMLGLYDLFDIFKTVT